jgi:hypothetical protein
MVQLIEMRDKEIAELRASIASLERGITPWEVSRPVENNAIFIRHCRQRFYTKEKKRNITSGLIWKSLYGFQPTEWVCG